MAEQNTLLTMLKVDLGIASTGYDARLTQILETSEKSLNISSRVEANVDRYVSKPSSHMAVLGAVKTKLYCCNSNRMVPT